MSGNVDIAELMQVRKVKIEAVSLVGLQGRDLDDQKRLFGELAGRMEEIGTRTSDSPYLVIPGDFRPIVAVEVSAPGEVPEGMIAFKIPEGDYVAFRFEKKHVGDFWSNICTSENQMRYNIDLSKPRFETFSHELQSAGALEWYIPSKRT
ncbi:GyrI-like domain-containing protein [Paenibacillus mesophilus]|uniref:GyrI-like domain-containing protein n=1 Tax=Paenibacillus mesophilus TaxID=2582849 RepID=UPI00110E0000|nr:GyrI-like domain-containing protein [Paenibacillus mesophilus]TMV52227.1 GyrI-like domain-containing protein [Paenibacillus mesophilus]